MKHQEPNKSENGNNTPAPNRGRNEARPSDEAARTTSEGGMGFGDMNLEDAIESGYTNKNGNAVDMTKPDKSDAHATGALTDIGSGRSSVVKKRSEIAGNDKI